jgi:hypothetical protein
VRRRRWLFACLALALALVPRCGTKSSSSTNATISVQVTNVPGSLTVDQSVNLTASVYNDTTNAGVDWTCSPSGACGSFNPAHTADGGVTVFTAPPTAGTITVTATSTGNKNASATATISIVAADSNATLNGPYVFLVQGIDTSGTYTAAGTILADGNGNITGGEQDYADSSIQVGPDAVTGSYTIGADGRGSITLNANNASLPNYGVETFSIAMTSSRHGLIVQFDGTATSSGTLDFQAAGAADAGSITGPYSFVASGLDIYNQTPLAVGGIAGLSAASGTVTGGQFYANDGGNYFESAFTGTMTGPDSLGRGTMALSFGLNFVYYAVRGEVLRLIEPDEPNTLSSGSAYAQGPAGASSSFSNATLTGNYAFYEYGSSVLGALALAGQFTADGNGSLTAGFVDTNDGGSISGGSIASQNVYTVAGDGTGTLALPGTGGTTQDVAELLIFATDPAINLLDPNAANGGGGALILDIDVGAVGAGLIVPQSTGVFEGSYAVNLQAFSSTGESDFVGLSVSDGTGNLTGTVDINDTGTTTGGAALSGTFSADASNPGRLTGSITAGGVPYNIVYYQVSSAILLILDVNTGDVGNGFLEKD